MATKQFSRVQKSDLPPQALGVQLSRLPRNDLLPVADALRLESPKLNSALMGLRSSNQLVRAVQEIDSPMKRALADGLGAQLTVKQARPIGIQGIESIALARLGERLTKVYDVLEGPMGQAKKLIESVEKLATRWRPMIEMFSSAISEFIEAQCELDERTNSFVRRHGWPVPLRLEGTLYSRIVGLAEVPKREVNQAMKELFRPGTRAHALTREILEESPAFRSRRPLLRQALKAQRRGEWYLVINALLPLVEGVLVDVAFEGRTPPEHRRPRESVEELKQADEDLPFTFAAPIEAIETMLLSAGAGVALFASFKPEHYGRPGEPRALNRHAVLHGAARRYGTAQNALKIYLLLVMLAEYFEYYESAKKRGASGERTKR